MDGLQAPVDALVQICDLASGESIYDGREGQVVVTIFDVDAPVVRFGTGDLSAWATGGAGTGAMPRLRGWLGRVGDAVKVRGMFLHPRQVVAVMDAVDGVRAYRFVIDRVDHRDVLRCELVADPDADPEAIARAVRTRVRAGLRFDVEVRPVAEVPAADGPIVDVRAWEL
jgi:phenylacetate-CoA ligase